jgi:hypothetical protein
MKLSETTVSSIVRALLHDRKSLSKSLGFWNVPGPRQGIAGTHVDAITRDLRDNAKALAELADEIAPWLKQRPDWQSIVQNEDIA